jgi:hypothetical protein
MGLLELKTRYSGYITSPGGYITSFGGVKTRKCGFKENNKCPLPHFLKES